MGALFGGEAALASVTVYAVHFMVEPRGGTVKIIVGKFTPRDKHEDVMETMFHI